MPKHTGLHTYRFKDNPLERKFHDAWKRKQENGHILEYLMGDGSRRAAVTERDEIVAATVVQWLGSPVGKHFLETVLGAK